MPEPRPQAKESMDVTVGSSQAGVSPKTQKPSVSYSHETSDVVPMRVGPAGNRFRDSLSFLSIKNTNEIYRGTGESGDVYDAEASRDF